MRVPLVSITLLILASCSTTPATTAAGSLDATPVADAAQITTDASASDASDAAPFTATLVDTHAHIWPRDKTVNDKYIDDLAAVARSKGVKVVLGLHARQKPDRPPTYSADHDTWTLEAAAKYPDIFVPALNGFDPADNASVEYVKTQLATGKWKMIGELDLRNRPKETTTAMNHANLMQIYALAGQSKVPVMMHFDRCYGADCTTTDAELDEALKKNASTSFITAHACPIPTMKAYANLYCEYEAQVGELPTELLDRVIFGTDVQNPELKVRFMATGTDLSYAQAIDTFREKLGKLSAPDQERVAIGTARLLKIID